MYPESEVACRLAYCLIYMKASHFRLMSLVAHQFGHVEFRIFVGMVSLGWSGTNLRWLMSKNSIQPICH